MKPNSESRYGGFRILEKAIILEYVCVAQMKMMKSLCILHADFYLIYIWLIYSNTHLNSRETVPFSILVYHDLWFII